MQNDQYSLRLMIKGGKKIQRKENLIFFRLMFEEQSVMQPQGISGVDDETDMHDLC